MLTILNKILSLGGLMSSGKRLSGFTLLIVNYLLQLLKSKYGINIELPMLGDVGMGLMALGVAHDDVKDRLIK